MSVRDLQCAPGIRHLLHFCQTMRLGLSGCKRIPVLALLLCLLVQNSAVGWEAWDAGSSASATAQPALGINDTFGRWTTSVKLVYDPDDAPENYLDQVLVQQLLSEAAAEWETVAGVRFTFVGVDAGAPDDDEDKSGRDGLVRVYWGDARGAAALAGPGFGSYNADLGYFEYEDGSVVLSTDPSIWRSNDFFVSTLVHEFGHLLGLGHSDNPRSIMYANPYNFLSHPREDDIRAMQALYGAPVNAIDAGQPQAQWLFTPPAPATQAMVDAIFSPNSLDSRSPSLAVNNASITQVDAQTPDAEFVSLITGGFGTGNSQFSFTGAVYTVDPFGYLHSKISLELSCDTGFVCGGASKGFAQGRILKSYPGEWKIHLVDETTNLTLKSFTLPVNTAVDYNQPPVGTVSVTAGNSPASAVFTVSATDPENNPVTVIWHAPGNFDLDNDNILDSDIRDQIVSGGQVSRSVDFSQAGVHTLFISLKDGQGAYSSNAAGFSVAGKGFQTLLQVKVTLPVSDPASAITTLSSALTGPAVTGDGGSTGNSGDSTGGTDSGSGTAPGQAVLNQLISTVANEERATTKANGSSGFGSNSTARFKLGASRDQGSSTSSSFSAGEQVVIAGNANPQGEDVGRAASIFLVIRTQSSTQDRWTYRDVGGVFRDWNGSIPDLQPAFVVDALLASQAFEIYQGTLASATHKIYIGYRLDGGSVLHFTGNPMRLEVSP